MTNQSQEVTRRPVVLLVDDVPQNLTLMGDLLDGCYTVKYANSGAKALRIAASDNPPDIILLDIVMPEMDGHEVCRRLKSDRATADIPVIFVTSKTEISDEVEGFALGAVDYISKTVSPPILLARIATHLRLKQFSDDLDDTVQLHTADLVVARGKLEYLIQTGLDLGRERDRMALLSKILLGAQKLLNCDAGTLYIVTERKTLRFAMRTNSEEQSSFEIPLYDENGKPVERYMATWCALHDEPVIIDDVYEETRFDVSGAKKMDAETGYRTISILTVPLSPRKGEVIGVLQLLNAIDPETSRVIPFPPEMVRFVGALAAQAAVAFHNHLLIEAQK